MRPFSEKKSKQSILIGSIGSEGGRLENSTLALDVPAGALEETKNLLISINFTTRLKKDIETLNEEGTFQVGPRLCLQPHKIEFKVPITLQVNMGISLQDSIIMAFHKDEGDWVSHTEKLKPQVSQQQLTVTMDNFCLLQFVLTTGSSLFYECMPAHSASIEDAEAERLIVVSTASGGTLSSCPTNIEESEALENSQHRIGHESQTQSMSMMHAHSTSPTTSIQSAPSEQSECSGRANENVTQSMERLKISQKTSPQAQPKGDNLPGQALVSSAQALETGSNPPQANQGETSSNPEGVCVVLPVMYQEVRPSNLSAALQNIYEKPSKVEMQRRLRLLQLKQRLINIMSRSIHKAVLRVFRAINSMNSNLCVIFSKNNQCESFRQCRFMMQCKPVANNDNKVTVSVHEQQILRFKVDGWKKPLIKELDLDLCMTKGQCFRMPLFDSHITAGTKDYKGQLQVQTDSYKDLGRFDLEMVRNT